ncbi:MAG: hypothetical protein LWW82_09180 [Comamonadaceae bacterium]|jgi:hypothetical protein|nr:hypothetical protein [Comamonadaceae bacterium]
MTRIRSLYAMAAAWGLALAALGGATAAHAHNNDVTWSVGVGVPGVVVGATNGRPYYAPPPVYYAPPPVIYSPPPVVYRPPPPVYFVPPPPPPVYYQPGYSGRHHHHHRGRGRGWDDDRD